MWRAAISRDSHTVKWQARGELAFRKRGGFELPIGHPERFDAIVICSKVDDGTPKPFPVRHVENAETDGLKALHDLTITGLGMPHIRSIDDIEHPLFTTPNNHSG